MKVTNGATLTINSGVTISFANSCSGLETDNGSITVFGTLTRLTGGGNYLWKGIRAKGQGNISFGSGALVEHAQTVVDAYPKTINGLKHTPYILGFDAIFRNNQKGFRKSDVSTANANQTDLFQRCNFVINGSVSPLVTNPVRIFEYANADKLTVTGNCSFSDSTALDVQAFNKQGGRQLIVSYCTFTGIDKGIYLQGSSAADRILNNTFNSIPAAGMPITGGYNPGNNYGVWLINTSAARMQDNTITGTSRASTAKIYGIIADNTGSGGDLMFRNTISNTFIGLQNQNNNSNYIVSCNNFSGYSTGFFVGPGWNIASGNMRIQGVNNCSNSGSRAGNEWSTLCTGSDVIDISIANSSSYFTYYAHFLDQQGFAKTRPECSTTAWETTYLNYCSSGQPGYQKTSTACNSPFAVCTNCRLADNDWNINPQLFYAKNQYRASADDYRLQFTANNRNQNAKEQLINYSGYEQLVSNEIIALLFEKQNLDTLLWYLEESDLTEDKKLLAEIYLTNGNYNECKRVLAKINSGNGLTRNEFMRNADYALYADENREYISLHEFLLGIFETGRNITELTEEELETLEAYTKTGLLTAGKECAYLKQATSKECEFEVLPYSPTIDDVQKRMASPNYESEQIELLTYPNPASTSINIFVYIPENFANPELNVFDLSGRKQESIILQHQLSQIELNTTAYPDGIYLLQIKTQHNVKTIRFSIQN